MLVLAVIGLLALAWLNLWGRSLLRTRPRARKPIIITMALSTGLTGGGLFLSIVWLLRAFASIADVDPAHKATQLATGISYAMNFAAGGILALLAGFVVLGIIRVRPA